MINRLKEDQLNEYNIIDILFDKINEIIDTMNQHNHFEDYINNPEEYDKQEENECIDCNCYNSVICESCQEQNKFEPIQKPKQSWQKKLEEIEDFYNSIQPKRKSITSKQCNNYTQYEINRIKNGYKQVIEELIKENEELNKQIDKINCDTCRYMTTIGCNYYAKQLQQKQPDQECIEWLQEKIDRYTYYKTIYPNKVDMWDVEIMKKLLKYFKEIK